MIQYQYKCVACDKEFDDWFEMGKAPRQSRCQCGSVADRLYTPPSVRIPTPVSDARVNRGKG